MPKHFLSVCAIIKDEGLYLKEWLEWHMLQGVGHFYLYDNESSDNTFEVLESYLKEKSVTLIFWPGKSTEEKSVQLAAYEHCFKTFGEETEWIACIDADEFLAPYTRVGSFFRGMFIAAPILYPRRFNDWSCDKHASTEPCIVSVMLKSYKEGVNCVLAHWRLFGSNGELEYKEGLVTERFSKCSIDIDHHVKSIVRAKHFVSTDKNVHRFIVDGISCCWTKEPITHQKPFFENEDLDCHGSFIEVFHYHTKSKEEYRKRCARGRADWPIPRDFETNFAAHDKNEIEGPVTKEQINNLKASIALSGLPKCR